MPIPELDGVGVLVTGGAGFIGSHLVDALVERGARVRVLDNFDTGSARNLAHRQGETELVEGDIRDLETCHEATAGVAYVFHQAALGSIPRSIDDPVTSLAVNVQGSVNVFTAAREAGARRVVYASSSSVYGDHPGLPKREAEIGEPLSPYALSKAMNEELARVFQLTYGQEIVGLRYFNVYGARQSPDGPYAAVIPRFFQALLTGERPTIYGDGEQSRDFTAVSDAVAANLLAAGAPSAAAGQAFNVAGGRQTSVNELATAVADILGSDLEPHHEPPRAGEVRHSLADLSRASEFLGYSPETDLETGLGACREYYEGLFATAAAGDD